jgi:MFS family permease
MEPPVHPRARFAGLWRHRDFLKLWAGQTISLFGSRVGGFALTFVAVLVLHASPIEVAVINAAQFALGLLVGPLAGVWVDRLRRRPVLICVDIARALVLAVIPIAAAFGALSVPFVVAVTLVVSVLTACFDIAYRAYLPALVGPDELIEGNSKLQASGSTAEFAGWSIAGFLIQVLSAPVVVLIDALSFIVSALSLASIRAAEPPPAPLAARETTWREIRDGLAVLRANAVLRSLAGVLGVWRLFEGIIGATIILFVTRDLHVGPALQGIIYAVGGVSAMLGAVLTERVTRRFGLGRTMLGALLLTICSGLCIPLASGPIIAVVAWLVAPQIIGDGARTIYEINQVSVMQARAPRRFLGRVGASFRFIEWGASLVGLLLGGVLGEVIGLRAALFVAVGAQLAAPLWLARSPVRTIAGHREAECEEAETAEAPAIGA